MTRYVIDASVAVDYLLRTPAGLQVAALLEDALLIASELMDVEVLSVLRRAVAKRTIEEARALAALEDLSGWQVDRISHRALARLAWRYWHNTSAYDAFYVAAARICVAPLLTAGGPLSRAPGLDVVLHNVRME